MVEWLSKRDYFSRIPSERGEGCEYAWSDGQDYLYCHA
ncbi:hypothetical protein ACPOL_3911 [Acidisarcina polymorpha]|uniref:Uncharacterized protein n=1 Tax=Acidisarcina polymorpha TaxID=2211140 RepID=A0A2Z5G2E6_9BACT|nr:hypothetical protein ACPOL_3911 [Acidisarcina polymorpha]